jgi:preprotein translocase subunit SecB
MQLSPLQLEDYLLKDLRFSLNSPLTEIPAESVSYDPLDIEVNAVVEMRGNDPLSWRCELTVRSRDEKEGTYPYTFSVVYVGFFKVVKDFPPESVQQMAKVNSPVLLYGAAREAIMYLTGRGRNPAVLLPSITFLEPPARIVLSKGTSRKASKKAAKLPRKK